jgi:hypothetical protein
VRDRDAPWRRQDVELLRPCTFLDTPLIARHMDACAGAAIRLGLTAGTVLALQRTLSERFGADLPRADDEFVRALPQVGGRSWTMAARRSSTASTSSPSPWLLAVCSTSS